MELAILSNSAPFWRGVGEKGCHSSFFGKVTYVQNRTALLTHPVFQGSRIPTAFTHFYWHEFSEIFIASHAIHAGSCHQIKESCTDLLWVTASLFLPCAIYRSQGHCECSLLNKAAYFSYMKNSSFETHLS